MQVENVMFFFLSNLAFLCDFTTFLLFFFTSASLNYELSAIVGWDFSLVCWVGGGSRHLLEKG